MDEHRAEPAAAMAAEDPGGLLVPEGPCAATPLRRPWHDNTAVLTGRRVMRHFPPAGLTLSRPAALPVPIASLARRVLATPRQAVLVAPPGKTLRRLGARSRCTLGSSSGCRGRSGGRERLAGGTADSGTGGRSSASRRSMRTGSTPAKSRTILCIWAVPSTARGVRRRLLPPSRRGRRRIVLSGPTLPPAISMSGVRSWANLATARGLWGSGQPLRA